MIKTEIRPNQEEICFDTIRKLVQSHLQEANVSDAKILKKVLILVNNNQFEDALGTLKSGIAVNCGHDLFELLYTQIMVIKGEYARAKVHLQSLAQKNGDNYRAYLLSGDVNRILSDYVQAEADYKKAAILNEKDEQALVNLADLYYQTGRLRQAYFICQKVLKITGFREDIHIFLQRIEKQQRRGDVFSDKVAALSVRGVYGFVSEIQIASYNGTGTLFCTGNASDILKESTSIARSFLKTYLSDELLMEMCHRDFHIHFPGLNILKDGPSAGLAIIVALFAGIQRKKITPDWAFTGEIDLAGRVLPVGDIGTKLDAANKNKIKKVFIPVGNYTSGAKIEGNSTREMKIISVKNIHEVLIHL